LVVEWLFKCGSESSLVRHQPWEVLNVAVSDCTTKLAKAEARQQDLAAPRKACDDVFEAIFQRLVAMVAEHLEQCNADGSSHDSAWYRQVVGRMRQLGYRVRYI